MLRSGDLNRLRRRSWADIGLVLRAFSLLGLMRAAIAFVPFRLIVQVLGMSQVKGPDSGADDSSSPEISLNLDPSSQIEAHLAQAAKIGWAVRAAAARTPWQSACLAQALAGSVMLRNRGIPFTLNLGVAKDVSSSITAHAWLTCGEITPTGSSGAERYHTISTFSFPG
jgi:hypothetical protein